MIKYNEGDIIVAYTKRINKNEVIFPENGTLFKVLKIYGKHSEVLDEIINIETGKKFYRYHQSRFLTTLEYDAIKYGL